MKARQKDDWLFVLLICLMIPRICCCQGSLRSLCITVKKKENLYLVIGCNSNSHQDRGVALLEFLNSSNLEILNQGNDPTYCSAGRLEVIDITLRSSGLLESFKSWEISSEPSLSQTHSVHFRGLSTGVHHQESQGYQLGFLLRGTEGSTGKGPKNERER